MRLSRNSFQVNSGPKAVNLSSLSSLHQISFAELLRALIDSSRSGHHELQSIFRAELAEPHDTWSQRAVSEDSQSVYSHGAGILPPAACTKLIIRICRTRQCVCGCLFCEVGRWIKLLLINLTLSAAQSP